MKTVTMQVCPEQVELIMQTELRDMVQQLKADLKDRKAGKSMPFFHTNKQQDVKELQRHIEAFELVQKYYGVRL